MFQVNANILIPGRGSPIYDGCVVVDGETIVYAGNRGQAPTIGELPKAEVEVLMPGLWDCHGHFFGLDGLAQEEHARTPIALNAIRAVPDAHRALMAGFTSVREAGGLGLQLAQAIEEGFIKGPTIYAAGAMLSPTGGHADLHRIRASWMEELAIDGIYKQCDGVESCIRAVRMQFRAGAQCVKICATGGVGSERDHPDEQQFSLTEMKAIVEEAERARRSVMAHSLSKAGALAAIAAGVRTIEHGAVIDDEVADAMLANGTILVPTRLIIVDELRRGPSSGLPDFVFQKERDIAEVHAESLKYAIGRGIPIALGTDCYSSRPDLPAHWGMNGLELVHLVEAGMSPLQAIEAGTANGPLTLGPRAPKSGLLKKGKIADMLGVRLNPLDDIGVLAEPDNVVSVWQSGKLVKGAI